jgi:hypothetical protein
MALLSLAVGALVSQRGRLWEKDSRVQILSELIIIFSFNHHSQKPNLNTTNIQHRRELKYKTDEVNE